MMNERSSPVCYGKDSEPGYMGYLSQPELIAFLNEMLEAERAGARVGERMVADAIDPKTKALARTIRRDEAQWCAMLRRPIRELGGEPSGKTGAFYEKAIAISEVSARFAFLNKGQSWVVNKLREALPKIGDDGLYGRLKVMLEAHEENIRRVQDLGTP